MLDVLKQAKRMTAAGRLVPDTLKASQLGRDIPMAAGSSPISYRRVALDALTLSLAVLETAAPIWGLVIHSHC
jgi:hypothetical protein